MVRVAVPPPVAVTLTGVVEPKLTMGMNCAPDGVDVTAAVSETLPTRPPPPVTVMVSVALLPRVTVTLEDAGARPMLGGALTVSAMVVEAVKVAEVPVIVTVAAPGVAVLPAVRVRTLVPVVGLGPKLAVTPVGRPVAASVTLPVNPPAGVTVMVSVAVPP